MLEKFFSIEEFHNLIDSSYDGIHITDGEGTTLFYNMACERIENIKKKDIIGKNVQEFVDKGVYPESITLEAIKNKKTINMFQVINGKNIMATSTPIFKDNKITFIFTNSRDITLLNNLQNDLERTKSINMKYQEELDLLRFKEINQNFIFSDPKILKVIELIMRVAKVNSTILIQGESGVGKEIIANMIHKYSNLSKKIFMKIDCGSLSESLLESELFGYESEAFTGAEKKGKMGLIEIADGGTLFLNEIDELSLKLQTKLLRVIQDKVILRLGGTESVPVNIRIIAATNKNLEEMIKNKTFRKDLFYRLNVVPIYIPPLRERKKDIYELVYKNLEKINNKYNLNKSIDAKAYEILFNYSWPGNVRELENIIERIAVTSPEEIITYADLPREVQLDQLENYNLFDINERSLSNLLDKFEKHILINTLELTTNVNDISNRLKIDPSTVRRKLKKHNLKVK